MPVALVCLAVTRTCFNINRVRELEKWGHPRDHLGSQNSRIGCRVCGAFVCLCVLACVFSRDTVCDQHALFCLIFASCIQRLPYYCNRHGCRGQPGARHIALPYCSHHRHICCCAGAALRSHLMVHRLARRAHPRQRCCGRRSNGHFRWHRLRER